jgi:chemotaxis protein CheD
MQNADIGAAKNSPGHRTVIRATANGSLATNLYRDRQHEIDAVKILPGEFYVTGEDMGLVTVLGSCVAACIRDPQFGIGGMNHFMLPDGGDGMVSNSARYGAFAMELLINELVKLGARRNRLEAKVFGGGQVLRGFTATHVGARNAAFVLQFLKTECIPLLAQDLLDDCPRKIYYFPQTGKVRVKRLLGLHNRTIIEREQEYQSRIAHTPVGGEVELF